MAKKHIVAIVVVAAIYAAALTYHIQERQIHLENQEQSDGNNMRRVQDGCGVETQKMGQQLEQGINIEATITSSQQYPRRLSTYSTAYPYVDYAMLSLEILFSTFRNLIVIGLCINMLEPILPFVILCDSFLMMAFLDTQMYSVKTFYYNIFNAKLDIMNGIRLAVSPQPAGQILHQLSQYNFVDNVMFNLSGELLIAVIFLVITVLMKIGSIFCNSQKLRRGKTVLRSMWNGFFMAILPRVATFSGFGISTISSQSGIINGIASISIFVIMGLFFIMLFCQIRSITKKMEYIQDSRFEIGLVVRLDYDQKFTFDCFSFNMLYHSLINYFRLLVFFIPIGASRTFYYASFGAPILSQIFMTMADISCPFFLNKRDQILGPINNFLLMLLELSLISIGLAQSVGHSQVSDICLTVLFGIASALFSLTIFILVMDVRDNCKRRCMKSTSFEEDEEQEEEEVLEEQVITQKKEKKKVKLKKDKLNKKGVKKTEQSNDIKEDESDQVDLDADMMTKKPTQKVYHLKIKKVRQATRL